MDGNGSSLRLPTNDSTAVALKQAIHSGGVESLKTLLAGDPRRANARIVDEQGAARTLLHLAADWPGFYPSGAAIVEALMAAGADPSPRMEGARHIETPLHWAASSDDAEVARALIDGGADLEAQGSSIDGGSPLDNAVGYSCFRVARLLVERGARITKLFQAAGMGMIERVEEFCSATPPPEPQRIHAAFWHACNAGERRTAEYLLARGADVNWRPPWGRKQPLDAAMSLDTSRRLLVDWLRERGARPS